MKKLIILFVAIQSCEIPINTYKIECIYCDSRPPKVIYIQARNEPNNNYIDTYKQAVPKFYGELNVCEVRVIK